MHKGRRRQRRDYGRAEVELMGAAQTAALWNWSRFCCGCGSCVRAAAAAAAAGVAAATAAGTVSAVVYPRLDAMAAEELRHGDGDARRLDWI